MGYTISIEKSNGGAISLLKWQNFLTLHEEFEAVSQLESTSKSGETVTIEGNMVYWHRHPKGLKPIILFSNGRLSVNNPDADTLDEMKKIAFLLQAQVIGEEGEIY